MPLPTELADCLAKRGIIQSKNKSDSSGLAVHSPGYVEEVIAENYDDPVVPTPATTTSLKTTTAAPIPKPVPSTSVSNFHRLGHYGCPNKCSVYHECSMFCVIKWGRGKPYPEHRYNTRRLKMLKKYPLPKGWVEIYDPGCGRYYYWKPESDEVCWLSPRHPKAKVSRSAAELRAEINLKEKEKSAMPPPAAPPSRNRGDYKDRKFSFDQGRKDRKRRQRESEHLDPMDPASYSDVPRGDWCSGLEKNNEAKTGVDTTAPGQLFQMRPYPSPGAVMRANEEVKKSYLL